MRKYFIQVLALFMGFVGGLLSTKLGDTVQADDKDERIALLRAKEIQATSVKIVLDDGTVLAELSGSGTKDRHGAGLTIGRESEGASRDFIRLGYEFGSNTAGETGVDMNVEINSDFRNARTVIEANALKIQSGILARTEKERADIDGTMLLASTNLVFTGKNGYRQAFFGHTGYENDAKLGSRLELCYPMGNTAVFIQAPSSDDGHARMDIYDREGKIVQSVPGK